MTLNGEEYKPVADEEAYKIQQKQRKMEREMRTLKKQIAVLEELKPDEMNNAQLFSLRQKVISKGKELNSFCAENGFRRDYERERVYNNILKSHKNNDIIIKKNLSKYIGKEITQADNQSVREWYYANVNNIPNLIDMNQPFTEQVKTAFNLRNEYKRKARIAMYDKKTAGFLEKKKPVPEFEDLLSDKMRRKSLSREEALEDILKTASKTNDDVNKEFGL